MISTKLRVKELLRERRWTTKVLAEKTGLSESYLTHIKNGTRRWNEDALKKLAAAFELDPVEIFAHAKSPLKTSSRADLPEEIQEQAKNLKKKLKLVPVVGTIPEHPSSHNNQIVQASTGFSDSFLPVLSETDEDAMFAYYVPDSSMAPNYIKGDLLVVCPGMWTNSGDIVAVEYGDEKPVRAIMQVNFMEDFVVLEAVNHKSAPIALVRGKEQLRIIGKVIARNQKLA